jgi:hypothetical protein
MFLSEKLKVLTNNSKYESIKGHSFFENSFNSRIWHSCMQRCPGLACILVWKDVLNERCRNWKKKIMFRVLSRLIFGSTMYSIWQAKNMKFGFMVIQNLKIRFSN